ncbi:MAG: APC family permease [Chitinophagaceae bacterium]|nr:APC family permease [Chitinophagaceae bacterium]
MASTQIQPRLHFFDTTIIVISLVIGMGIFRNPSEVALKAGQPSLFFGAWVVGAIVSLCGALIFAEIGGRFPVAGGFYRIFSHCYHPAFAFMVNWLTLMNNAAATGLVAIMGSAYIAPFLLPGWAADKAALFIGTISIAIIYLINLMGIRISAHLLNGLMFVKIGLILLLISAIFFIHTPTELPSSASSNQDPLSLLKAFGLCFIPVFFTYGGYQQTMNFGGDVQDAKRNLPKAITLGMIIIFSLYLTVNYAFYHVLGFTHLQQSTTIASDITGMLMGPVAEKLTAMIMFFAVMAYVNVSVMSNPRVYYAMAQDEVLPRFFMRIHPRTQVQIWGVTTFFVFILICLFSMKTFSGILNYVMFFDSISIIAAAATIFIFRRREQNNDAGTEVIFKMKAYPWLPIFFIVIYSSVILSVFLDNPESALWGALLFIVGWPLYYVFRGLVKLRK